MFLCRKGRAESSNSNMCVCAYKKQSLLRMKGSHLKIKENHPTFVLHSEKVKKWAPNIKALEFPAT